MTKEKRWTGYYDAASNRSASPLLLAALQAWEATDKAPGVAIDLGCGTGMDTFELLRRSWKVLAIDRESEGIGRLTINLPEGVSDNLTTQISAFEGLTLPRSSQLINASFSLPFCAPEYFDALDADCQFAGIGRPLYGAAIWRARWLGAKCRNDLP